MRLGEQMIDNYTIKDIAVLGAGVMGAQIAAHLANAGFRPKLYDLCSDKGARNAIALKAIAGLKKLKPQPLGYATLAQSIVPLNYDDDLNQLKSCDLIIEAVAERLDIKQSLYEKITPYLSDKAIIASNTSGISINTLGAFIPQAMRQRFCGVHFFNPPRYMHLLELIPGNETQPELLNFLEAFFVTHCGKGVVRAKDTPNFIANRIGVFSLLATIHHAEELNLSPDVVDALTGSLIGRPKSATFRTMDVVGLDTMKHVINTMKEQCTDDPWRDFFVLPEWLNGLINQGALGQKTKQGIYKKQGKAITVFSKEAGDYVSSAAKLDESVVAILKEKDVSRRFEWLKQSEHPQAQFLYRCHLDLFHYCAYHLSDIANNTRDLDLAIRFGFGWTQGPFEIWQSAGVESINLIQAINDKQTMVRASLPNWCNNSVIFYQNGEAFNPHSIAFEKPSSLPVYQKQLSKERVLTEESNQGETQFENEGVRLWSFDNEVMILSFKGSGNSIGFHVLDGINQALDICEKANKPMVLWQESAMNFSLGANLKQFVCYFSEDKQEDLNRFIENFQNTASRLTMSSIPTVAALRGRALGGGLEMVMHCQGTVAAFESYVGLVEMGVGLIPAGGGLKTLAKRASQLDSKEAGYALLEQYFKAVAMATVASSALDGLKLHLLPESTDVVMNQHEVLAVAIEKARYLKKLNTVPAFEAHFPVFGMEGNARLQLIITNMMAGGFISEHDALIANKIAYVITGGDLNEGEIVDESWFHRLEREAFISLASTEKTKARVEHLLQTGKPLRN